MGEEVKEQKERIRIGKRGEERRRELKWKDPTSQIAPITGRFRSQFLQKALAAVPQSLFLLLLTVSFALQLLLFLLSYDPSGVTIGKVLPSIGFPSVCEFCCSQQLGTSEPALMHLWV